MKKIIPFFIMICCLLAVSSCSYDNFEEPKATLTGKAIYDGEAVGVRSGSSEFALFQDGYALKGSIPVYIAQRKHSAGYSCDAVFLCQKRVICQKR